MLDYFRLRAAYEEANPKIYPHRKYDLIQFAQFSYIPLDYTINKIKKLFVDYNKPYKSPTQVIQDYKQPFVGLANTGRGILKIFQGIFTLDRNELADGGLSFIRGALEILTMPFAWIIKPIVRLCITSVNGAPNIEAMPSMKEIADLGHDAVINLPINNDLTELEKKYRLLAVTNDLHRKFVKSSNQGQKSNIQLTEQKQYGKFRKKLNCLDINDEDQLNNLHRYFSLFSPQSKFPKVHDIENISNEDRLLIKKQT